jgi:hypothetical protein
MADDGAPLTGTLQTKSLDNGDVEIKFIHDGKEAAVAVCSPEQVSDLVAHLLRASHAAFVLAEKAADSSLGRIQFSGAIPVTQWTFGHTETHGQRAVLIQVGDAVLGFAVQEEKVRELGRTLVAAAWKFQSSARLRALLWSLTKEFATDLRGRAGCLGRGSVLHPANAPLPFRFGFPVVLFGPSSPFRFLPVRQDINQSAGAYIALPRSILQHGKCWVLNTLSQRGSVAR